MDAAGGAATRRRGARQGGAPSGSAPDVPLRAGNEGAAVEAVSCIHCCINCCIMPGTAGCTAGDVVTTRGGKRAAQRRASRRGAVAYVSGVPRTLRMWPELQRAWWVVGAVGGLVAALGFQTLPPSRRLEAVERVNARQDSVFAVEAGAQREALDTIRRQLGQLLAGQCAKEKDGMARVLYGCGGR